MRRLPLTRALALGLSLLLGSPGLVQAVTPTMGTTPAITTTTINQSNGPQRDPHVSGSLVSYTDFAPVNSLIHVFDLATGVDTAIPGTSSDVDFLSDVNGSNVVFTRIFATKSAIMRYSTAAGTVSELDP